MSIDSFVPSVMRYREDADVPLYLIMLTLKLLKPRSLLPMIKNRPLTIKKIKIKKKKVHFGFVLEPNQPGNKLSKTRQISGREWL